MSDLRLAVWGAGVMGERVARAAAGIPGVAVTAVIDTSDERAAVVASAVGAAPFRSLADAEGIDAVYIGLPNAAHHRACLEAASRGLHVLVDKPLTVTLREADEVVDAAMESGRYWMVGFSYRFRGEWRRARDIVRSGGIGEPYFVSDNVIEAYESTPKWYWSAEAGGGTVRLQSHHVFDRWEWVLGRAITAVSALTFVPADRDADLAATLSVQLGAGIIGSSALSFGVGFAAPPRVAFTIQGTQGSIELDESRRLLVSTPSGTSEESFDDDWLSTELADFVAGVRGEDRGQPTIGAGRRAVQLAELAGRSAAERRWVETVDADE
jgi:predicted dehydrogenase